VKLKTADMSTDWNNKSTRFPTTIDAHPGIAKGVSIRIAITTTIPMNEIAIMIVEKATRRTPTFSP